MSFWDIFWFITISFFFVAYISIMFQIVVDLFRDPTTGGFAKAVWVLALVLLPFLSAFVYLVARGDGMARRAVADVEARRAAQEAYVKEVVGETSSPAEQIAHGKDLLDSGAISEREFASLKAKALA